MKENKDTVVIDDKKLKQTKGGAANWISTMGQVVHVTQTVMAKNQIDVMSKIQVVVDIIVNKSFMSCAC